MLRIHQIKLAIDHNEQDIERSLKRKLGIPASGKLQWRIARESMDLRKGQPPRIVYSIDVESDMEARLLKKLGRDAEVVQAKPELEFLEHRFCGPASGIHTGGELGSMASKRPVVVGFGPAGMFAAELLSRHGLCPLIIERGSRVDKRVADIERFWSCGALDPESNVQFGEGGAGTFSDGKLTSRSKDPRGQYVLDLLATLGAPDDIRYRQKPHVGTDVLRHVVVEMRRRIENQGGEFMFDTRLDHFSRDDNGTYRLQLSDGTEVETEVLVLAIGHSARDTFEMLHSRGVAMTAKPFAVGLRIEHLQSEIDRQQYGEHLESLKSRYGAADYKLTATTQSGRGVYTFCMCPGGEVVGASSETGGVVTNGMSQHARDLENANSAILVTLTPQDYGTEDVLAGMKFQRHLEQAAYQMGHQTYGAPYMKVGEFLGKQPFDSNSGYGAIRPSYTPGPVKNDFRTVMPPFLLEALQEGLEIMGEKMKAFADGDAILTAFETRSSSPVRLVRDENTLESVTHSNLYPCGEGAGYAGGITSSAIDGIRVAERILKK
jgi:hypothetical protein